MRCIKTGCLVFLDDYQEFVYGDAYTAPGGDLVVRVAGKQNNAAGFGNRRHFTALLVDHWFDRDKTSMDRNSTLVVEKGMFCYHGYEGIEEPTLAAT